MEEIVIETRNEKRNHCKLHLCVKSKRAPVHFSEKLLNHYIHVRQKCEYQTLPIAPKKLFLFFRNSLQPSRKFSRHMGERRAYIRYVDGMLASWQVTHWIQQFELGSTIMCSFSILKPTSCTHHTNTADATNCTSARATEMWIAWLFRTVGS